MIRRIKDYERHRTPDKEKQEAIINIATAIYYRLQEQGVFQDDNTLMNTCKLALKKIPPSIQNITASDILVELKKILNE